MAVTAPVVGLGAVGLAGERLPARFAFEWAARDRSLRARTGQVGTLTRADNDGTILDARGRVRTVNYNLPRWSAFDLDGDGVREATALLGERTRTNLVTHAEDLANAAWLASAGGLPTQTGGQADPMGGTVAYLLNDADAQIRGQYIAVTFGSNGTKAVTLFMRQGTAAAPHISLYDATAAVHRHRIIVTWDTDGIPVLSTSTGTGTLNPPVRCADGWWRISFTVTGVLSANANRLYLYPASGVTAGTTGSVYVFGVQVEDEDFASSYVRTTGATAQRVWDDVRWTASLRGGLPISLYARFVESGLVGSAIATVIAQISGANPRFNVAHQFAGAYKFEFYNGVTSVGGGVNVAAVAGDLVELLGVVSAAGAPTIYARVNGGSVVSFTGSAIGLHGAWGDTSIFANGIGSATYACGLGLLDLRVAYGAKTMEEMAA